MDALLVKKKITRRAMTMKCRMGYPSDEKRCKSFHDNSSHGIV